MTRPNILLITADHLRADALASYGNRFARTPHSDRLAAEGVVFSNFFTPNPVCVPARASITTGNYSHRCTGCKGNGGLIRDDQVKLAEHFGRAGYRTCALGKLHYDPYAPPDQPRLLHGFQYARLCEEGRMLARFDPQGKRRGIEDYHDWLADQGWEGYERAHCIGNNDVHPAPAAVPQECYVDAWAANQTISTIENHLQEQPEQPLLTWCSFTKPHAPYDPPEPWHRYYDPRQIDPPLGSPELLADRSPTLTMMRHAFWWHTLSPQAVQLARAYYWGQVSFQDAMIGRLLNCLDRNGLRRRTIVIYTADHGDLLGDFGCFFKGNFLNGAVKIPGIISAPGLLPEGIRSDCPAGLQDILPTLAGLTELPLDRPVQGLDLTPLMQGRQDRLDRPYYVSQHGGPGHQAYMLCDGHWKYIYSELNGVEELYDELDDPAELRNLAGQVDPAVLTDWRTRLIDWCRTEGDHDMLTADGLVRTEWQAPDQPEFRAGGLGWRWY